MTDSATYEVNVKPSFSQMLRPRYECSIYRTIKGGVCGPTGEMFTVLTAEEIDLELGFKGYTRESAYEIHPTFSTAKLDRFRPGARTS